VEGNEAEAETCNKTEPNTGLCEVFVTYTVIPYYLQKQFVNGILRRTIFYFGFFLVPLLLSISITTSNALQCKHPQDVFVS
jgi:hypothetical protein